MLAGSHIVFGTGSFLLVSPWVGFEGSEVFYFLPIAILGALLPDLDARRSALKFWWWVRWLTYPLQLFGHRTWSHSLLMIAILIWPLSYLQGLEKQLLLALIIGYASHIIADWMTHRGVPLLYPLKLQFRAPITFRTGSWVERPMAWLPFGILAGLFLYYGDYPIPVAWF